MCNTLSCDSKSRMTVGEIYSFISERSESMKMILVVDNNPVVTKFMTNRLEKKGYHVLSAENGLSALNILETFIPDVIFIDLVMPNISGEKLCRIIRNTPQLKSVFIVIISGVAKDHKIDFIDLGANACIAKGPFNKFAENIFYVLDQLQTEGSCDVLNKVIGLDDIYEREITKELLSSREHFEVILNNNSDGILELTQKATVVYANPAAISFIGLSETKLLSSNFIELFHREADRKRIKDLFERIGDDRKTITEDEPVLYDGREFTIQISPVIDKINDSLIVIMRDITKNKCAQRALEESEKKYRKLYVESKRAEEVYGSLLNSSADAIVIYDLEGKTHYVNFAFTKIFGWKLEEVQEKKMPFLPESEKQATRSIIKELIEKGTPCHGFETKRYTKDQRLIDVSISASRYDDHEGKPAGLLAILRDITEKRKLETQLQQAPKMEAIGTLAVGVAHNFNNILGGIVGNAELALIDIDSDHPNHEKLQIIKKLVQKGAKLTGQLLGYARKERYEIKPISLNLLVEETAYTLANTRKDINVHLGLSDNQIEIIADQDKIEQVLLALYVNAADAMPGVGDLFLKTTNISHKDIKGKPYAPKPGDYVMLTDRDTGNGMDEKTMARIFEPFFSTKGLAEATGLGMASAYGIIKVHGGYMDVESKKGYGTTFSIYLPTSNNDIVKETKFPMKLIKGNGTLLLVDDENMILDVGKQMITIMGYDVLTANSGKAAIEKIIEHHSEIDIVILDMVMPEMDGGDTYDILKKINKEVKVILSSGYSLDGKAEEIMNRGCSGFIQKPFSMKKLSQKISESNS